MLTKLKAELLIKTKQYLISLFFVNDLIKKKNYEHGHPYSVL